MNYSVITGWWSTRSSTLLDIVKLLSKIVATVYTIVFPFPQILKSMFLTHFYFCQFYRYTIISLLSYLHFPCLLYVEPIFLCILIFCVSSSYTFIILNHVIFLILMRLLVTMDSHFLLYRLKTSSPRWLFLFYLVCVIKYKSPF